MVTYSPSATTGFGSVLQFGKIDETHKKIEKEILDKVQAFAQKLGFDLGILANAYSESKDLKELFEIYGDKYSIYSDSGGLQALTLGKDLTLEKPRIYDTQSLNSHYAMCFDEMPTKVIGPRKEGAHSMLDQSGRYYVKELVIPKGIETGKNIQEQINAFKERNAIAKIMVIVQGYDMEQFKNYSKAIYDQIDPNDYKYISGLAFGNTIGPGPFHLIDRIARYQYELDFIPEEHLKHIHLLAAGSPGKLLGPMGFPKEFWKWDIKDFKINADATSHSSTATYGRFTSFNQKGKRQEINTGKGLNKISKRLVEQMYEFTKDCFSKHGIDLTFDEFRNTYTIFNDKKILSSKDIDKDCEIQSIEYKKIAQGNRFLWFMHELKIFFTCLYLLEKGEFSKVFLTKQQIEAGVLLRKCTDLEVYNRISRELKIKIHNIITPMIDNEQIVLNKIKKFDLF